MSNSRSAFEAIPGKDALVEYVPKVYPVKSYVEKDGLVYKSLTGTSNTFISSQWELIADLREVRVPNISSRNALTGNTPTSGTTGIRIPILDNTNVLVLNAIADPQVASNKFARYNYNQTNGTWLLLQAGTGATNSNVSNYQLLSNKPSVVSGITVNVGAGLTGGGSVLGTASAPYAAGGTVTVSHADTSSIADINNSGYAYVQKLNFDGFGHVTGGTSSTWVHPDTSSQASVVNSGYAYIQSISVDGDGHLTSMTSSTWVHPDTSSQANSINVGNTYIQSISLDGAGHVIGLGTGTISGGGSGFNFKLNGDSGGVVTIPSGGTVTISGGTGISTLRTGSGMNTGIRVSVLPAGATTQVQLNNAGALGANANFTYNSGTNILTSPNYNISAVPTIGTLSDNILIRNTGTGAIERINTSSITNLLTANNGLNKIGNNYRLGGTLTGDTSITGGFGLFFTNNYVTIGTRSGATGTNSFTSGINNLASGAQSQAFGQETKATNTNAHAEGTGSIASGLNSHAEGRGTIASGSNSHAQNNYTIASGYASHAGGGSSSPTKEILASGYASFNHSYNTPFSGVGNGAIADYSAILGGQNHHINASNINSVIIGGNNINLTGSTYIDHAAVPYLALMRTPPAGLSTDNVLVWNATDKKVKKVTQASLAAGAAGANTYVQYNNAGAFGASATFTFNSGTGVLTSPNLTLSTAPTIGTLNDNILVRNTGTGAIERIDTSSISNLLTANNGITKNGNNFSLGGTLTGDTTINTSGFGITWGTRAAGSVGIKSMTIGISNIASGTSAIAIGNSTTAGGDYSFAQGFNTKAIGIASTALGYYSESRGIYSFSAANNNRANGAYSFAVGIGSDASGFGSFASGSIAGLANPRLLASGSYSFNHSYNDGSQTIGHGAVGFASAILGGQNHNIAVGNDRSAIIGGNAIKLTSGYADYVAVPNLAIFTTPVSSVATDLVLAWNSTDKKVKLGTLASTSDIRLKKDFTPIENVVDKIDSLDAYEYTNNDVIKPMEGIKNYGLTAQQVENVFPHVVKDNYDYEGEMYKTVDYRHLVPVLFAAIKELNQKIKDLESKIK